MPRQTSGRFLLRVPPALHAELRAAAQRAGVSLNEYCARKLSAPETSLPREGIEAVRHALTAYGPDLIAVVVFGSWARGTPRSSSDVDLLVVLESHVAIGRKAYRAWDEIPLRWGERRVELHLVHLPAAQSRVSGLWADVAVDGAVLFERGLRISRRLGEIREQLAEGRMTRRRVHGQPYWVEVG